MRAARLTLAGSEPRFEVQELPQPVPAAGEVVDRFRHGGAQPP